jgi:hypothetical protein
MRMNSTGWRPSAAEVAGASEARGPACQSSGRRWRHQLPQELSIAEHQHLAAPFAPIGEHMPSRGTGVQGKVMVGRAMGVAVDDPAHPMRGACLGLTAAGLTSMISLGLVRHGGSGALGGNRRRCAGACQRFDAGTAAAPAGCGPCAGNAGREGRRCRAGRRASAAAARRRVRCGSGRAAAAAGGARKAAADQEVAIAVHQRAGGAAVGQGAQGVDDGAVGWGVVVVADPGVEQVAEDEQRAAAGAP